MRKVMWMLSGGRAWDRRQMGTSHPLMTCTTMSSFHNSTAQWLTQSEQTSWPTCASHPNSFVNGQGDKAESARKAAYSDWIEKRTWSNSLMIEQSWPSDITFFKDVPETFTFVACLWIVERSWFYIMFQPIAQIKLGFARCSSDLVKRSHSKDE
jgi:hypothetical protein